MQTNRRELLGALAGTALFSQMTASKAESPTRYMVLTNAYPWTTFAKRDNKDFNADLDASLAQVKQSGVDGFEPILTSAKQVAEMAPLLKKHTLAMPSIYVNSKLHDGKEAQASITEVLNIAEACQPLGTKIIVTNPAPIRWGGKEDKNDEQLHCQAEQLNKLGAELRKRGQTLAYHNHDSELRQAAREFHHMLAGTDPENVKFCLDSHWVFRGAGDSNVALFDVLKLYGSRVVELHLRQSRGGVWTEDFNTGDIDYAKVWAALRALKLTPFIVLEQAVEAKSTKTMSAVEAHKKGVSHARSLFV